MSVVCGNCRTGIDEKAFGFIYRLERTNGRWEYPNSSNQEKLLAGCAICDQCWEMIPTAHHSSTISDAEAMGTDQIKSVFAHVPATSEDAVPGHSRANFTTTRPVFQQMVFLPGVAVIEFFPTLLEAMLQSCSEERANKVL